MLNKKLILIVVIALMLAVIGFEKVFFSGPPAIVALQSGTPSTVATSVSTVSAYAVMQPTSQLFIDFRNYSRAYEVWPTFSSARAQQALNGFDLQAQDLGNNIYKVSIVPKIQNHKTQTFIVMGDSKIYFIETSFGDDTTDQDYVYSDDYAVAVNAAGYVLQ